MSGSMTNGQIEEATDSIASWGVGVRRCLVLLAEAERDWGDLAKVTNIETLV